MSTQRVSRTPRAVRTYSTTRSTTTPHGRYCCGLIWSLKGLPTYISKNTKKSIGPRCLTSILRTMVVDEPDLRALCTEGPLPRPRTTDARRLATTLSPPLAQPCQDLVLYAIALFQLLENQFTSSEELPDVKLQGALVVCSQRWRYSGGRASLNPRARGCKHSDKAQEHTY